MSVCLYVCMYVCMYVCVCMHACMHACVYVCGPYNLYESHRRQPKVSWKAGQRSMMVRMSLASGLGFTGFAECGVSGFRLLAELKQKQRSKPVLSKRVRVLGGWGQFTVWLRAEGSRQEGAANRMNGIVFQRQVED